MLRIRLKLCFLNLIRFVSEEIILAPGVQKNDWYLTNIKQYGYYRVNYDKTNWDRLTKQLLDDHKVIMVMLTR